jgi:hypothetical protein
LLLGEHRVDGDRVVPDLLRRVAVVRPVFIWGQPGIGKSSLVEEFAARHTRSAPAGLRPALLSIHGGAVVVSRQDQPARFAGAGSFGQQPGLGLAPHALQSIVV